MGSYGAGKSFAWLCTARKAQETGSPAMFYCLDTDDAIQRMLDEEFSDLQNVMLYRVFDWPDYEKALAESVSAVEARFAQRIAEALAEVGVTMQQVQAEATSRNITFEAACRQLYSVEPARYMYDWIVVDLIDLAWEAVQSYFVAEVFQQNIGTYFLEARKALKGNRLEVFDGWKDWSVINKVYTSWINQLIFKAPAHIFATAKIEPVSTKTDDAETLKLYGEFGVKPKGQKSLGHQFHTILLFTCMKMGDWRVTTVKERASSARRPFAGQPLKNFPVQYLVAKAGWEL